jgi:iron complex outermembrane receptor protein
VHGALGYGFRLPTYTDLYYSDPTTVGNPNLQPESAWNYEGGVTWSPRPQLELSATAFTSPQHNSIDYTRVNVADLWHATNLANFRYTGVETAFDWRPARGGSVRLGYTFVSGVQSALNGLQSEYVFNFPVNNASVEWIAPLPRYGLQARTRLGVVQRFERTAYAVADASLTRPVGRIQPYVQITNLTNTGYEEVLDVRMQGRAFIGGIALQLTRSH